MQASIRRVYDSDKTAREQVLALLEAEGISADKNLDYTIAVYDEAGQMAATGSYFKNTLRCLAVSSKYRGEGLMNLVVSHLRQELAEQGVFDVFMYTKYDAARYFGDLGFYTLAEVDREVVFMENSRDAFRRYLNNISRQKAEGERVGAIVMNANPFTLGHLYLVEQASAQCDVLHLFVVREDVSDFPFVVRERLIKAGTQHLKNIRYHDTGNYMVSSATFPSYFIQDSQEVTKAHAAVDAAVFAKIAKALNINQRFVGDEPFSFATNLYNQTMAERLPQAGIKVNIIKRKEDAGGTAISATRVRQKIKEGDLNGLAQLLPPSTLDFLQSEEGSALISKLQSSK